MENDQGELCHRLPKAWFERTDKRDYEGQLSAIERRQARLASIRARLGIDTSTSPPHPISKVTVFSTSLEHEPYSRYAIGATQNSPIDLLHFTPDPSVPYVDPYLEVSNRRLFLRVTSSREERVPSTS
jgi:hypothetical protein